MKKILLICAVFLMLFSIGNASTLTGDNVSVELWSSTSGSYGVKNVLVGAGDDGNYFQNQYFDLDFGFDGDIFKIASRGSYSSIDGYGGNIQWRLTGLDFGVPLTGINFIQPYSNVIVKSLGADYVTFEYFDIAIPSGTYFQAQFLTDGAPVPEPATMLLFGLGLLGLAGVNRRKK